MTLHEAIESILMIENGPMKATDITDIINSEKLFHRKDGRPVPPVQVLNRVRNYSYLFNNQNGLISLNRNAKNNLKILEDYLFDIINSSRSRGKITNSYFVIAFFLFYRRLATSFDIYSIKLLDRVNLHSTDRGGMEFNDTYSAILNSTAVSDFRQVNSDFFELGNELERQISDLPEQTINNVLDRIWSHDFSQNSISKKEFSFFYNNLLRRFAAIQYGFRENSSAQNVNKLLSGFLPNASGRVIDPFAGFGGSLLELRNLDPEIFPVGYEMDKTVWALGYMNLFLNTNNSFKLQHIDSLRTGVMFNDRYDFLISDLPLLGKFARNEIQNFEFLNIALTTDSTAIYIQYILSILSEKGKAVIVLPAGFLFKSNPMIKRVREVLINNDWVETIITLPLGILQPYSGVSTAVLILNKNKRSDKSQRILMVDVEKMPLKRNEIISDEWMDSLYEVYDTFQLPVGGELIRDISIIERLEVVQSDYDFLPRRYTMEQSIDDQLGELFENQPVRLGEILTKIKTNPTFNNTMEPLFLAGKNLKNSTVDYTINLSDLDRRLPASQNMYSIEQPALLIQTYFKDLKPSYFEYNGQIIYVTNQIAAFSVDIEKIDVGYLIGQLHETYLQKQLNSIRKGTAQSFFSVKDFLLLKIKLPGLEEQKIYKEKLNERFLLAKEKEIVQLEVELLKSKEEAIAEQLMIISSIQHDLGNKLPALKHSFSDLRDFLFQYAGQDPNFKLNSKIRQVLEGENENGIDTLLDVISRADSILNYTIEMVDDASGIISADPSKYKPQKQRVIKFIKTVVINHYGNSKNIIFEYPENVDVMVNLDGKQFSKALCNVIDNAIRHGFLEKEKTHHIAFDLISGEESEILLIKNDGLPFPEDFDFEAYKQPYKFFGTTGHTGLGGYIINRVIENHQGKIDLIKDIDPADPYRVKIEIKFPKPNL